MYILDQFLRKFENLDDFRYLRCVCNDVAIYFNGRELVKHYFETHRKK
jgi:hypothetical protein